MENFNFDRKDIIVDIVYNTEIKSKKDIEKMLKEINQTLKEYNFKNLNLNELFAIFPELENIYYI